MLTLAAWLLNDLLKNTMKKLFSILTPGLAPVLVLLASCQNNSADSVKEAKQATAEKTDSARRVEQPVDTSVLPVTKDDADFIISAADGGMLEVELGRLAQTNAASQGVKDFGNLMIRDHSKGGDEIKSLVSSKRVVLPAALSNDHQKKVEELQKKKGAEFDKSYIDFMVGDHREDIRAFEKAAKDAKDPDIKAFANNHLPMLHQHLDSAEKLLRKLKKVNFPPIAPTKGY